MLPACIGTGRGSAPRRVGIWCDYGFTLSPAQGIGVLVHNLARGLIEADDQLEMVLLICPKDPEDYRDLVAQGRGRIRLYPERWPGPNPRPWQQALRLWLDGTQSCYEAKQSIAEKVTALRAAGRMRLLAWLTPLLAKAGRGRPFAIGAVGLAALAALPAFLVAWIAYAAGLTLLLLLKVLLFPILVFDRLLRRMTAVCHDPVQNAAAAECDVWIIPWINLETPLPTPSVLLIHDLVHEHFPDAFEDPSQVVRLRLHAPRRAAEATFCACMSAFIRDNDLLGVLRLQPSKARLLPQAGPANLPDLDDAQAARLLPNQVRRPYLLYPAGFRSYKNHRILIEALHNLRTCHSECRFELVFTGYADLPAALRQLVDKLGLQAHVHVLNAVDRPTLAALYLKAFATLAPSLYEQGSFPLFEALHYGCPVACSHIPAFVEQCRSMGDAMLYFDPHDPESVARCVLAIRDDREGIRKRQWEASRPLRTTTWRDVAGAWLSLLQEAVEVAGARSRDGSRTEGGRACA